MIVREEQHPSVRNEPIVNPPGQPGRIQRPRVQSAHRAVGILLAVAQSDSGLTTREISERLNIGRQATYHLLHTLLGSGMLTRNDRNRYLLGRRVGTLAEAFARQLAPAEHLAPAVRLLAQETGETAYASGWFLGDIAVLTVSRGTHAVQAAEVPRGYVGNAHARASGKLLLAFAPDAVRNAYLEVHPPTPVTPKTIVGRAELDREFAVIRHQRYALDNEEFATGLCCVAVPFDDGFSPFVLGLSAPRERFVAHQDSYLATMRRIVASGSNGVS
jgi:IclR family acetate operon transcriptional repressor